MVVLVACERGLEGMNLNLGPILLAGWIGRGGEILVVPRMLLPLVLFLVPPGPYHACDDRMQELGPGGWRRGGVKGGRYRSEGESERSAPSPNSYREAL